MQRLYYLGAFIIAIVMLTSCEEDFVFHREAFNPKIVVNSIFKPGEKWTVHLSTSRDILSKDSKIKPVENAVVIIKEKTTGREIFLKHNGEGVYSAEYYPPLPDKMYELSVEVPGHKTIKASSRAPKKANIVNISTDIIDSRIATVQFQVKGDESQYLIWNYTGSNNGNPYSSNYYGMPNKFISDLLKYNSLVNVSNMLMGMTKVENDAFTKNGSFTSAFIIDNENDADSSNGGNQIQGDSTIVYKKYLRVVTASSELYNYYKTVEKFSQADNHNSSFSTTPDIYSNIQNGLGIFAGYTEELTEID